MLQMKHNKNRRDSHYHEYDDEYEIRNKKKDNPRRRAVKNWKKAWTDYSSEYIDKDDFYGK